MDWQHIYGNGKRAGNLADGFFQEQKKTTVLNGWFKVLEIHKDTASLVTKGASLEMASALRLKSVVERLPLSISDYAVFAGTQNDGFSSSYALIHPSFKVEEFKGYCDPLAVFSDLGEEEGLTNDRVMSVIDHYSKTPYVNQLKAAYVPYAKQTEEALFFVEQVTGHLIPDFSQLIRVGTEGLKQIIAEKSSQNNMADRRETLDAMRISLDAMEILAGRYREIAERQMNNEEDPVRKNELLLIRNTLASVPNKGAQTLFEAIQVFILGWQMMCLEQSPNPYAFSAGNIDRLFEPYREKDGADRESAAGLFQALLAFFNVGDRSWAISQNLLLSGRNVAGEDLTNETTYAIMDAFFHGRYPQPIMSVRLHKNSPEKLYETMGNFFFTPGQLTPSLFNDDSMIPMLIEQGIAPEDAENYAVGGCQEPIIMGKDNANSTNSWLNLAKVLEVTLNEGHSTITGTKLALSPAELTGRELTAKELLSDMKNLFYLQLDHTLDQMSTAGNACSRALSNLRVPFLSCFMGGLETAIDLRDDTRQGTKYNGSGCLIHGLSILADSFQAIEDFASSKSEAECENLLKALKSDFEGEEVLRQHLLSSAKFGNDDDSVDAEASQIIEKVSARVREKKNYLGNPFRPDWSSPSTHLLYGYWTGATPDGRKARTMLAYGVDPLFGEATSGMNSRLLSLRKLPYEYMNGGCACHLGINPANFPEKELEDKGVAFKRRILNPLFNLADSEERTEPFYLYVNVTTAETLRKVLKNPAKYAPSGVYIMRIHGTFVNFLDLSPAIQEDIILRLGT